MSAGTDQAAEAIERVETLGLECAQTEPELPAGILPLRVGLAIAIAACLAGPARSAEEKLLCHWTSEQTPGGVEEPATRKEDIIVTLNSGNKSVAIDHGQASQLKVQEFSSDQIRFRVKFTGGDGGEDYTINRVTGAVHELIRIRTLTPTLYVGQCSLAHEKF